MLRADDVRLLEADPELARLVPESRRDEATKRIIVRTCLLRMGEWDATGATTTGDHDLGLFLLEGIVAREVIVADNVSTELLGPGDLIRP